MLRQNINNPDDQVAAALNTIGGFVASPFTGAVNDTVLLFAAASLVLGPPSYIVAANDANAGTSITIFKPGVYLTEFYCEGAGEPVDFVYGLSQDVAPAGLNSAPSFAIAGFLDVQRITYAAVVGTTPNVSIKSYVVVSPEQSAAGSIVRFHASTAAGAAPALDLLQATPFFKILRVNQAHS